MSENDQKFELTGVKLANELMVDLMGALIPGVLFLFSVVVSAVFPLIAIYGFPFIGEGNNKVIDSMSGWFWVVTFFTFLILSYAIGHIFYRSDIKEPDRKDLLQQRAKNIKVFFKDLKNELRKKETEKEIMNREDKKEKKIGILKYAISKLNQEIKYLYIFPPELHFNADPFLVKVFDMNRNVFGEISHQLERVIYKEGKETYLNPDLKYKILKVLFPSANEEDDSKKNVLNEYQQIVSKKLNSLLKNGIFGKNTEERGLVEIISYYCILNMQCECACSTAQRCDFPYINYYKYLLKRNEIELLPEVSWYLPNARSKNKINHYKIKIQLYQPRAYSIINKNESHIRMAASCWYVAKLILPYTLIISFLFMLFMGLDLVTYSLGGYKRYVCDVILGKWNSSYLIAILFPLFISLLLWAMKKRIMTFIHYQRLREIYHTLVLYKECERYMPDSGKNGD